ncbi:MAG TPA: hypothetical protein VNI02_04575 [Blastocatellia bacterium]|jgi:hypothetical protein|nr:hypothetical protein [Blastocatellia bacterium]
MSRPAFEVPRQRLEYGDYLALGAYYAGQFSIAAGFLREKMRIE